MSSMGGKGHGIGGGGSGGRIAVHTSSANEYKGFFLAVGQKGTSTGDMGGPGTVFIEDKTSEFEYQSRLYLDGQNLSPAKPVVIWEKNPRVLASNETLDNNADVSFDHLMLNKKVRKGYHFLQKGYKMNLYIFDFFHGGVFKTKIIKNTFSLFLATGVCFKMNQNY